MYEISGKKALTGKVDPTSHFGLVFDEVDRMLIAGKIRRLSLPYGEVPKWS